MATALPSRTVRARNKVEVIQVFFFYDEPYTDYYNSLHTLLAPTLMFMSAFPLLQIEENDHLIKVCNEDVRFGENCSPEKVRDLITRQRPNETVLSLTYMKGPVFPHSLLTIGKVSLTATIYVLVL